MVFLDILQSYIIKGVIILIILKAILLLQGLLYEHTEKARMEGELSTSAFTFTSEMRNTGYNTSLTPFTIAETSKVEVLAGDSTGSVRRIRYYLTAMPSSSKFYLTRTLDGGPALTTGRNFRKFYFTFYDSIGQSITLPASATDLKKIKSISVLAKMENDIQFNGDYLKSYWQAQIIPPNLNK
jgi:hypothetical protein